MASFDLNGRVPVIENVFGVLVLNAPGQMIMKADTDLCIVKGLCRSETARNYAIRRPFLALQPMDCVDCTLNDSGVLNQVFIVRKRVKMFAVSAVFRKAQSPRGHIPISRTVFLRRQSAFGSILRRSSFGWDVV